MTNALVQQANDKANDIDEKVKEFFDKVNGILSWVPDLLSDLVQPIIDGMNFLREKFQEFWARVQQCISEPGNSDHLRQAGDEWVNRIGNPLGDVASTISPDKLKTNWEWRGRAADAYKATVPAQVAGLNSIKDIANQLKSSLGNLANGIDNFWTAMIAAFVTFVVAAVGAIAAACTVVGTPAAIAALLAGVGVSLGLVTAAVIAMQSYVQVITGEQANITQKIHDDLGDWANSNIDALGHASVNDPDGTNWHVNS